MKLPDTIFPTPLSGFFDIAAPARRFVSDDVAAQDIQDLIELRARVHRHIEWEHPRTVMHPGIGEYPLEVRVLLIHRINHDELRDAAFIGKI